MTARSAVLLPDGLHAFALDRPWSVVTSGLFSARQLAGQGRALGRFRAWCRGRGTTDPRDWADIDTVTGDRWARGAGLATTHARSWRPAYHGFYFQDSATSSAAALAAMAAHGLRQETLTYPQGLAGLTDALAVGLTVRTGAPVIRVRECGAGVTVETADETVQADAAVVAVPGPRLRPLLDLRPDEEPLADTPYSHGLLALVGTTRRLTAGELGGAYGVLCAIGTGPVAALCVASRAGHAHGDGDVVTVMFTDAAAAARSEDGDDEILRVAREQLARLAPTLGDAFAPDTGCHVERIPYAMPATPPGRVSAVTRYRAAAAGRRVVVAGDSHAWPWTDSAAAAGRWAAETVIASTR